MVLVAGLLIGVGTVEDPHAGPVSAAAMAGYVSCLIALFVLAGLGNGSVYKMIPTIFATGGGRLDLDEAKRSEWARVISGIVIGFVAGVGTLGGVGINLALRESFVATGTMTSAFWIFLAFYVFAALLTWITYVRRGR
jgi:NNP family nitrate/nitrite transporter-like MFS transporter